MVQTVHANLTTSFLLNSPLHLFDFDFETQSYYNRIIDFLEFRRFSRVLAILETQSF